MNNHQEALKPNDPHPETFLAGVLLGGLAGAGAMLLLAPQSGRRTRAQLRLRGMELRDQVAETVDDVVIQTRLKAHQLTDSVRDTVKEIQQNGQDLLAEQQARLSALVAPNGKTVATADKH